MTESPTMPLPAVRPRLLAGLSPEAWQRLRRETRARTRRQHDIEQATLGQLLERGDAVAICARMSAWCDQSEDEAQAVRDLMRRHGITAAAITESQRAQDIPVTDRRPLRRTRRALGSR